MSDAPRPHRIIDELVARRRELPYADILAELAAVSPLADENDPCWDDSGYGHGVA
jgi:hypothetical protein